MNPYFIERLLQLRLEEIERAAARHRRSFDLRDISRVRDSKQSAAPAPTTQPRRNLRLWPLRREG